MRVGQDYQRDSRDFESDSKVRDWWIQAAGSIEYTKMHGCLSCVNCLLAAVLVYVWVRRRAGIVCFNSPTLGLQHTRENIDWSRRLSTPVGEVKYLKDYKAPSHYCLAVHNSHLKSDSRVKDQNLQRDDSRITDSSSSIQLQRSTRRN